MRNVLLPLLLVVGGLLAYHLLVASDSDGGRDDGGDLERLRARVAALEDRTPADAAGLESDAVGRRLATLEARIDALAAGSAAPAAGTGDAPAPGEPGYVWDDRSLEWLQAALTEARRRNLRERQADQYRSLLGRIDAELPSERKEEVVALVMGYHDAAAAIYVGGSAGTTKEEREESARKLTARRADLERSLRALVSDQTADQVMRSIPAPPPVDGQRTARPDK